MHRQRNTVRAGSRFGPRETSSVLFRIDGVFDMAIIRHTQAALALMLAATVGSSALAQTGSTAARYPGGHGLTPEGVADLGRWLAATARS